MAGGRFRELIKKYGKVAFGVHCSVSAVSITSIFIAIKNNVDVESILDKWHLPGISASKDENPQSQDPGLKSLDEEEAKKKNRTAELVSSTGGAFALALLCNKALFPVRVPITIALTPPVARFLARRKIIKNSV